MLQGYSSDRPRFDCWTLDDCPAELSGGLGHWTCHIAMGKLVLDSTAAVSIWLFEAWKLYQFDVETMLIRCTTTKELPWNFILDLFPCPEESNHWNWHQQTWVVLLWFDQFLWRNNAWNALANASKNEFEPKFLRGLLPTSGISRVWPLKVFYVLPICTCDSYDARGSPHTADVVACVQGFATIKHQYQIHNVNPCISIIICKSLCVQRVFKAPLSVSLMNCLVTCDPLSHDIS